MKTLLGELGLESVAVALEESLDKLNRLSNRMEAARGVSQGMAMEAEQLMPGFLKPNRPIGYFSTTPSKSQYRVSLEEISKGMWAAIAVAIASAFAAVIGLIFMLVGGGDSDKKDNALVKAVDGVEKSEAVWVTGDDAVAILQKAPDHDVEEAIKVAFKKKMFGHTAMEDMSSHSHTALAHFSLLDVDMLMQHGLYAFLYSDRDLAPTANTLLKPALADADRIVDEFDKGQPDYKNAAAAIVRLRENRVVNDNWEDGMHFADYVQMLLNHRDQSTNSPLKIERLSDFTELVRGVKNHSQKSCDFFKDLLKRNGDILENLAYDAKSLAKRSTSVQHGVSANGTEEDSKALVNESQKYIMNVCKSLRALGSYVHLTIWAANRHSKFVMFLHTSLRGLLTEARNVLKERGLEVPDYFNEALRSLSK